MKEMFVKCRLQKKKNEMILAMAGQFKQIVSYLQLKNSGDFNGIRTHDLCDASAVLLLTEHEVTQLRGG